MLEELYPNSFVITYLPWVLLVLDAFMAGSFIQQRGETTYVSYGLRGGIIVGAIVYLLHLCSLQMAMGVCVFFALIIGLVIPKKNGNGTKKKETNPNVVKSKALLKKEAEKEAKEQAKLEAQKKAEKEKKKKSKK